MAAQPAPLAVEATHRAQQRGAVAQEDVIPQCGVALGDAGGLQEAARGERARCGIGRADQTEGEQMRQVADRRQKAVVAGIPVVASVSAPSSLAVQLARELHLTLVGFLRGKRFIVYAGEERLNMNS